MDLFNNEYYMRAWASKDENGNLTTYVKTGPAGVLFPLRRTEKSLEVFLINQRRQDAEGRRDLKAIGGYLRESNLCDVLIKNAKEKAGIVPGKMHTLYEEMAGYTTVFLPIASVIALGWDCKSDYVIDPSCETITLSIEDAVEEALRPDSHIHDQSTRDGLFTIYYLFKNQKLPLFF